MGGILALCVGITFVWLANSGKAAAIWATIKGGAAQGASTAPGVSAPGIGIGIPGAPGVPTPGAPSLLAPFYSAPGATFQ